MQLSASKNKKINDLFFFGQNKFRQLLPYQPSKISKPIHLDLFDSEKQIKQITSGIIATSFLFENGKVVQCLRERDSNQNPQEIPIENIKKISGGDYVFCLLTEEGEVFAKGINISSNNPKQFINISSLIEDPNDQVIQDIVSGFRSVYLLSEKGNVYGIGSNGYGQLGLGLIRKAEKPILMMENVSRIFSGNCSLVFLLNSNQELFVCGDNDSGQVGLGKSIKKDEINQIAHVKNIPKGKIIDIQTGWTHSVMLVEDENQNGTLYSCGDYQYNGLGNEDENAYEFTEIKSPLFENDNILEFRVGDHHTLILTSKGKLIGFGRNHHGQLGIGNTNIQSIPTQIQIPELLFDISSYHLSCGDATSFLYYSPVFSNLQIDLIKLFQRKEFCDISFKTKNENETIEAHKLILKYRLKDQDQNQNQNQFEQLQEIISKKTKEEANQIFEMIYSSKKTYSKLYKEIRRLLKEEEDLNENMQRIYFSEKEKDFIIQREEKEIKFPKLILIMRSELYRGMFLSVTNDSSNQVNDYSEISDEAFEILEYWIYTNQIKEGIEITQEIIDELEQASDYFELNESNPNLIDLLIEEFDNQNPNENSNEN